MYSVSAIQFTGEKSEFKCLAATDRNRFRKYDSKLGTKFYTKQVILENLSDELNASQIK